MKRGVKMQKIDYEEMARRLILNGAEAYKEKFILEVDILSGYDRQRILEEMDKQIDEIKHSKSYKKEIKRLENRIHYICGLEDCNEEFEL
jgi:hypothetical protein